MSAANSKSVSPSSSPSAAVVDCRALVKQFRDFWLRPRVTAVDGLDLQIEPGELYGLLGPNGSGKSTTIKMLLGLLFPTSGTISVFGAPASVVATKQRIGYLPEETHLYPFLTARETLDFYGRLFSLDRRERRRRADELIEMVGLSGSRDRPVGEYSKGMQRRIGLAQALINDPDLLILDEPTSGLDPIGTRQVKDLMISLQEQGKTLLLSSHLLADVEDVCSRVMILYGGRAWAQGTVESLLAIEERTIIRAERLDDDEIEAVKSLLGERGRAVLGVEQPHLPLEKLFLDLVDRAQRDGQHTSGASTGGELAGFLRSDRSAP